MIDVIKELIDKKITNLHPDTEKYIIEEALEDDFKIKQNEIINIINEKIKILNVNREKI